MEQAHVLFLILRGAGFHHRADNDFKQPAADGVDHDGDQKPRKRIRQRIRKNGQQDKSCSRSNMRQQNGRAVTDAIQKPRREQINAELNAEIDRDEQRDFRKRDLVRPLEHDEQQRNKVIDDGLHDIADIAAKDRPAAGVFHGNYLIFCRLSPLYHICTVFASVLRPEFFSLYRKKHLTNANFRRILRGKLKPLMQTSKQTGFLPESCRVVRVQQKDVCRMDCGGQAEREGK